MVGTLQNEATELKASAREHKRASEFHRREAKRKMILLATVKEKARSLGIQIILTPNGEGNNHGQA